MTEQTTPRQLSADEVRPGMLVDVYSLSNDVVASSGEVQEVTPTWFRISEIKWPRWSSDPQVTLLSDAPTEDPTGHYMAATDRMRERAERAERHNNELIDRAERAEHQRDEAIAHVHALKASHQELHELLDDAAGKRVISVKRLRRIVNGVDRG